ncbi:serine protease [Schizosaccharomyces japonicus yFS275]|uniref:Serine protease n=1 Tax=Schizosaccharomyces japonicus (strain yFS275 / FY16936) TaxID=402676 RepID=B6K3R7_SCHJY|nr:serine protease [Schizosaccharomyces japonicus yFS275]EEB08124.2 serine protease [Schizosaccharomyces japonicus yFS275]
MDSYEPVRPERPRHIDMPPFLPDRITSQCNTPTTPSVGAGLVDGQTVVRESDRYTVREIDPLKQIGVRAQPSWDFTIKRVVRSIVSIRGSVLRSFDTENAGSFCATGFVVDKNLGIILSNRHVVSPAPITARASFINYEEIDIYPLYRDPVHDFGFFRYNPSALRFHEVDEIPLAPELARVGADIRVIGNDAGEKLSILSSTLARLDRAAPNYGVDSYNDFNTFYYQAASGTSGGSSGSPVLDISGSAVALNAGGSNKSASSFYLPLDRVVRALHCIQNNKSITRGTFLTEFQHYSYDELSKIGLPTDFEIEARARNPQSTGLLVAARILRNSQASEVLEPGDVLIGLQHSKYHIQYIIDFVSLFEIADERVGHMLELIIFRPREGYKQVRLLVQDLHSVTPSRFLEVGGTIFHDLSYQLARSYQCAFNSGTFVAASGMLNWSGGTRDFLVTKLANIPTPNLEALTKVILGLRDNARVPMHFRVLGKYEEEFTIVTIDRHFFLSGTYSRNDKKGSWDYMPLAPAEPAITRRPSAIPRPAEGSNSLEAIQNSMVLIHCRMPFSINGFSASKMYSGTGVVVSVQPPLIVADRSIIPVEVCDVRLTFQSLSAMGFICYMDKRIAVLSCEYLPDNTVQLNFVPDFMRTGEECTLAALDTDLQLLTKSTTVRSISAIETERTSPPRFRYVNFEVISLMDSLSSSGGLVYRNVDGDINVTALWMSVVHQDASGKEYVDKYGLSMAYIMPLVKRLLQPPASRSENVTMTMGVEWAHMSLAGATTLGLSQQESSEFYVKSRANGTIPRPMYVVSHLRPLPKEGSLRVGDVLLEVNGKMVTRPSDLLEYEQSASVQAKILRDGQSESLEVLLYPEHPSSSSRIIGWSGAVIHETQDSVYEQVEPDATLPDRSGVYVGSILYGSPALNHLRAAHWIVAIDGESVETFDKFLEVLKTKQFDTYVQVKQMNRRGVTNIASVRPDLLFWPTWIIQKNDFGNWYTEPLRMAS